MPLLKKRMTVIFQKCYQPISLNNITKKYNGDAN